MFLSVRTRLMMLGAERRTDAVRAAVLDLDHDHVVQQAGKGWNRQAGIRTCVVPPIIASRHKRGVMTGYEGWTIGSAGRHANQTSEQNPHDAFQALLNDQTFSWEEDSVAAHGEYQVTSIVSVHERGSNCAQLSCISTTSLISLSVHVHHHPPFQKQTSSPILPYSPHAAATETQAHISKLHP